MPFVNVRTTKGMLTKDQKQELQERLNALMVEIEGGGDPTFKDKVWIMIEETEPEDWNIGGVTLTPDIIQELKRQQAPKSKGKS
ncbi:tautomerase family protein [Acaryochloris marina]|uniref:tautomerase family protein n=1 Tax=Acaryochloris marina TaxID=155978 RepID=UPI001BAFF6A0|nr:tautomerase family protein [Acaryochloris marina]QUY42809.1 tautomerase family protein [Acaryochloris marina S15]